MSTSEPLPTAGTDEQVLRSRLAHALVRNRTKGFHLTGHLLAPCYERISTSDSLVTLEGGPHVDADGGMGREVLGVLADLAFETAARAAFGYGVRLATVALHLQFTGAVPRGRLQAVSAYRGLLENSARRQAITDLRIQSGDRDICMGSATFVILDVPAGTPVPTPPRVGQPAEFPAQGPDTDLDAAETQMMDHSERALRTARAVGASFLGHFWGMQFDRTADGASGRLPAGVQVANRAGFVHGGILVAFAQAVAQVALPGWITAGLSIAFLAPGNSALTARATIVHAGRTTAVVRVEVLGSEDSRVLEGLATLSAPAATA